MKQKKVHSLTIFLIKQEWTAVDDIINSSSSDELITVPISGLGNGQLFIKRMPHVPPWAELFQEVIDEKRLIVQGVSAALLVQSGDRFFVLTFGQSGRFFLRSGVSEERFGLICTLNSVDPHSFRSVDVQSLDAIQSHSRIQAGEAATPDEFGLDVERDMLKAVVGAPKDSALGSRMGGSESLSVSVRVTLADLPFLLKEYRTNFETELSHADHQWVNNIALVKKPELTEALEGELSRRFAARQLDRIWLSIPEIIDWSTVAGFIFVGGRGELHPDITLDGFLRTLQDGQTVTIDLLRKRTVFCADVDHQRTVRSWPVFRCLYAELDLDGHKYILNDGKWYNVDVEFVARTNADFSAIELSDLGLPIYEGGGEGKYNADVAAANPDRFALLDQKVIPHGGGHGRVEVCDLLGLERELIHIKLYAKSSVLSHLFAQGFVSGQLLQIDPAFRVKVREKLKPPFVDLIEEGKKPTETGFKIIYAIISNASGDSLELPFFSRVNLNNAARVLRGFGYRVQLLKIAVDEKFAMSTKFPPQRKMSRKSRK